MTITITGTRDVVSQILGNGLGYIYPYNVPRLSITDTATQTVTATVTQQSFLHSHPGFADDQVTAVASAGFSQGYYANGGSPTNPPVVTANTFTVTGPLNSSNVGPSDPSAVNNNLYGPVAYSPLASLGQLQINQPSIALQGNQILETDVTLTVTDSTGASSSQQSKFLFTNPVVAGFFSTNRSYSLHDVSFPLDLDIVNANDFNYGNNPGSTSVRITQTNILHTDPNLAGGDQRIAVDPGKLTFVPPGGDATNAATFDAATGILTATGTLHAAVQGTPDPIDYLSGYAPHDYSPMAFAEYSAYTPASSVRLNGNEWLETIFTATVTDGISGSTQIASKSVSFANPVHITLLGTSLAPLSYGTPVSPFNGAFSLKVPSTGTVVATISQTSFIHTDPGAADDQKLVVGPGMFADNTALGSITATPAGLTTVGANQNSDLNSMLSRLVFTPAQVTLTGHQTLETDFTLYVSDAYGDFDTFSKTLIETTPVAPATTTTVGQSNPPSTAPITPTVSVFRFFDSNSGTHFFTSSTDERNTLLATRPDLVEETNGFGAVDASAPSAVAVFRFFDTIHGTQFITSSTSERNAVLATRPDLTFEAGDLFYEHGAQQAGDVSVYRFFDTKLGTHFYTGNQSEHDAIATPGGAGFRADLISEGVAFYAPTGLFK